MRRDEELKRLKNLKKKEIQRRMQQIREVTGNEHVGGTEEIDLDAEFEPETHDKEMGKLLGEDFDEQEERGTASLCLCW